MGVVINPSSEYGKELARWEQRDSNWNGEVIKAGNPYVYRPYPKMLYRAHKRDNGKVECCASPPSPGLYPDMASYERASLQVDQFNRSCQLIVPDEHEHNKQRAQGWYESPSEALAAFEKLEQDIARAAAETNFAVSRMGSAAKAEHSEAEREAEAQHVTDLVGKKRGRKPKVITPQAGVR